MTDLRQGVTILPRACVCEHDHKTHRGEHVELCIDCSCGEWIPRCQNCGGETEWSLRRSRFDACSLRCLAQLEYAESLKVAA